jgi:putative ABC transport system permease protein
MSLWRQLRHGLQALVHPSAASQDVADEVQHFFTMAAAHHEANGLPPRAARRAARLAAGNPTTASEQVHSHGWEFWIESAIADARYAMRRLRAAPGFTLTTVLTLTIGIGATTTIAGAVYPILFEPLPYAEPRRIVMISDRTDGGDRMDVTFGTYTELLARSRSFSTLAVMRTWQPALTRHTTPERLHGQRVSASYFRTLGTAPFIGHDFDATADRPHGDNVTILSYGLWQQMFGGDRDILGHEIALEGDNYTVIGVMPATFDNVLAPTAQLWSLLQYDASLASTGDSSRYNSREWGHHLTMVGRLRSSNGLAQATREVASIANAPVPEFARPAWASLSGGMFVHPLQQDVTSSARPALLAMLGAVLLLLLIACMNVTNLLLARATRRRGEVAMRAALGAARSRIIRQLLTESVLLSALGGTLGLGLAAAGVRVLAALSPTGLPRANAIRLDAPVFVFAAGVTTLIGLVVGLLPALQITRTGLGSGLRRSTARTVGGPGATRGTLVIAEVALALVLLVSGGLMLRSISHLLATPPGFSPAGVLTMQVGASGHQYDSAAARHLFFSNVLDAVRRVPGVSSAALTSQLPLSGDGDRYGFRLESDTRNEGTQGGSAARYAVVGDYAQTMDIRLRRGRLLNDHDGAGQPLALMVSESLAREYFPGMDAIGQRMQFGPDSAWGTIVGVVNDVKQASLSTTDVDAIYVPAVQWPWADAALSLVVRSRGDAAALLPAVKTAIWSVDKDQPIIRVATMDAMIRMSAAAQRFALTVFEVFGIVALALAAIGLYGVVSASVAERIREIGVRSALGASPANILGMVIRQGMTLTAAGIAIGIAGAIAATRAIASLLFDVSPLDAVSYITVIAVLACVAAIACWLPARRAAGSDPLIALRME